MFTDGVTRLVDFYGQSWDSLFAMLRQLGPRRLISVVRDMELKQKPPYGKRHDDATAVYIDSLGVHDGLVLVDQRRRRPLGWRSLVDM